MLEKMEQEIEKIVQHPGIRAAYGQHGPVTVTKYTSLGLSLSDEERTKWDGLFSRAEDLLKTTEHVEARIILNDHVVWMHQEKGIILCVAFYKGDPVSKSLSRTLRRTLRRLSAS